MQSISSADHRNLYEPVKSIAVDAFVRGALAEAIRVNGAPVLPIRKVLVYRSEPISPDLNIERNFQRTCISDEDVSLFIIFVSAKLWDGLSFRSQLAHEVMHLLNAHLCDPYVEGLNTVFAQTFLTSNGIDWTLWESWFEGGNDPFYGGTYLMMREIKSAVPRKNYEQFLKFAVNTNSSGDMHIDIDSWLSTLTSNVQAVVVETIGKYAAVIQQSMPQDGHYFFALPARWHSR